MPQPDIEKLGFLLHETSRAWRTKLDQRLKPLGLSMGKWTTLAHLARGGDKLTQAEGAVRVGVEEPTLAGILNRLEDDGWIVSYRLSEDGSVVATPARRPSSRATGTRYGEQET